MADEFERIARLSKVLARASDDVLVGIGDDAAVLRASTDATVITVDASVEGTHFRRDFGSFRMIARRAIIAAASDLAAMGAAPRAAVVAMNVPSDIDEEDFDQLIAGSRDAVDELAGHLIGGNLAQGRELSITTTWLGSLSGPPLLRAGARVGDEIYVTGHVGAAALGLHALMQKSTSGAASPFIERWRTPHARVAEGQRLRGIATSCIDISDGLVQDLKHVCDASGVGAEIDARLLPLLRQHTALAAHLGVDPWSAALAGGEDYELLFTAPPGVVIADLGTRIGRVTPGSNVRVAGTPSSFKLEEHGYVHFRA
ncbi:MAG: thiamine-phosphate kinase [Sandaracinaceae bacterium]|nr:thiamine-phosphate kinase [Sandaracinaceae bacterium]